MTDELEDVLEDANVYYYNRARTPTVQVEIVKLYGPCWICKGTSGRLIVAFDRAQRSAVDHNGYASLCKRCIPAAKTLAALCGWRKP